MPVGAAQLRSAKTDIGAAQLRSTQLMDDKSLLQDSHSRHWPHFSQPVLLRCCLQFSHSQRCDPARDEVVVARERSGMLCEYCFVMGHFELEGRGSLTLSRSDCLRGIVDSDGANATCCGPAIMAGCCIVAYCIGGV